MQQLFGAAMLLALMLLVVDRCSGNEAMFRKLVYIYEFPDNVVNTWPPTSLPLETGTVWKHAFNENEGFGHWYNGTNYFETWQYSSFRLILSRLLRSQYRTRNISEASIFVIPYDSGAECYVDEKGNFRDHGNPLGDGVMDQLRKLPTVTRNGGLDHLIIHSSSLVAHQMSVKLKAIFEYIPNATIVTVERQPKVHRWIRHLPFLQPIPMASMYHWRKSEGRDSIPALKPFSGRKTFFISYFGSAQTSM